MTDMSTETLEQLAITTLRIQEDSDWCLDRLELLFFKIAISFSRKANSIKADVVHPDGFAVRVSAKCYANSDQTLVEILRRSGDSILFNIIYQQIRDFDFGRGENPKRFYQDQICPRIIPKPLESPILESEHFFLEDCGVKRKIEPVLDF